MCCVSVGHVSIRLCVGHAEICNAGVLGRHLALDKIFVSPLVNPCTILNVIIAILMIRVCFIILNLAAHVLLLMCQLIRSVVLRGCAFVILKLTNRRSDRCADILWVGSIYHRSSFHILRAGARVEGVRRTRVRRGRVIK